MTQYIPQIIVLIWLVIRYQGEVSVGLNTPTVKNCDPKFKGIAAIVVFIFEGLFTAAFIALLWAGGFFA